MNVIEQVAKGLDQLHVNSYEVADNCIIYRPDTPDGFMIILAPNNQGGYTVSYDGWHEEFNAGEEAIRCFLLGLSKTCRLRVHTRGKTAYKWAVEWYIDGDWRVDSMAGLFLFPFWRRDVITYRSNRLTDWPTGDDQQGAKND